MTRTSNFLLWTKLFSSTFTVTGYFPPLCSFTVTLESQERFPKLSIFEWEAEHLGSRIHAWHHPLVVRNFTLYISSTRTLRLGNGNPKLSNFEFSKLTLSLVQKTQRCETWGLEVRVPQVYLGEFVIHQLYKTQLSNPEFHIQGHVRRFPKLKIVIFLNYSAANAGITG